MEQTVVTQVVASMPVWLQWIFMFMVTVFGPTVVALVKSEKLAMDPNTLSNGILHGRAVAKRLLAITPDASIHPASQLIMVERLAILEAELKALQSVVLKERSNADTTKAV